MSAGEQECVCVSSTPRSFKFSLSALSFSEIGSKSRLNETNLWGDVKEVSLRALKCAASNQEQI